MSAPRSHAPAVSNWTARSTRSERSSDDDPVEAVHAARKAIKKERSLLRLARAALPAKQRRAENAALRRAARGLSDARDAEVMVQTLDGLSARFAGQLPASNFAAIREHLGRERDAHRAQLLDSPRVPEAAGQLAGVRARIDGWRLRAGGWQALAPGLERSYRRGRRAMREAERRRSAELMHAWRKRVKDLWYQERFLAPVGGPVDPRPEQGPAPSGRPAGRPPRSRCPAPAADRRSAARSRPTSTGSSG